MADAIKTGSILIAESALLPAALLFKSEPYAQGWRLVKNLDSDEVNQIISQAGWSFLYMAGVIKTRIFGADEAIEGAAHSQFARQRARINTLNSRNSVFLKILRQRPVRAPTADDRRKLANHETGNMRPPRLDILAIDAVIAD